MACRAARPKRELLRLVRTPAGAVVADPTGRLPGRGAYVCADTGCWDRAARRRAVEHALGVPLPGALADLLGSAEPVPSVHPAPAVAHTPTSTIVQGGARGQE